jgi:hypothetical protein
VGNDRFLEESFPIIRCTRWWSDTTSPEGESALPEAIIEFNSGFGTGDDNPRLLLTRFPTVVSVALYQAPAEVEVVRVNGGPTLNLSPPNSGSQQVLWPGPGR